MRSCIFPVISLAERTRNIRNYSRLRSLSEFDLAKGERCFGVCAIISPVTTDVCADMNTGSICWCVCLPGEKRRGGKFMSKCFCYREGNYASF